MAYPINRFDDGNYVLFTVKLEPGAVAEVEKNLMMSEEILRHLVIKKES
ncbi:MAG: 30S ribosomal protein S6 [Dehalococcoidia bacterium]|nr:30S ribosomal protein S6 [Dehalococcoidia bacterium]